MKLDKKFSTVPAMVYDQLEKYNEVMSKGRCRLFYKGLNRNSTYFTDEFAEKLISTIPYAPVKGIYENNDFEDHGTDSCQGRIYGIVPENPNFAWEEHEDEDGITREYACVDVLIYTALYEEAKLIVGKAQSMEIYGNSVRGNWEFREGRKCFVFEDGCFLGLQVLGTIGGREVEPCFEGASFYNLKDTEDFDIDAFKKMIELASKKLDQFQAESTEDSKEGGEQMEINFKLSDDQKYRAIWDLLNPDYNEAGGWVMAYAIGSIYDDYALVFNFEAGNYERAYYEKDDETDSVKITKMEKCFVVDVNEDEKKTLDNLRANNNNSYENLDSKMEDLENKNSEFSTKIDELGEQISTLSTERDNANSSLAQAQQDLEAKTAEFTAAQESINTLTEERDALATYKKNAEDEKIASVIAGYADLLSEEVLDQYRNQEIALDELDMHLTYEVKKAHPEMFSKKENPSTLIPKNNLTKGDGINSILDKYENKH